MTILALEMSMTLITLDMSNYDMSMTHYSGYEYEYDIFYSGYE